MDADYFQVDTTKNDVSIYCAFCEDLGHLAEYLNIDSEETEKLIFSRGGMLKKNGMLEAFCFGRDWIKPALGDAAKNRSSSCRSASTVLS